MLSDSIIVFFITYLLYYLDMFGSHDNNKQALDLDAVYSEQWTYKKNGRKKKNHQEYDKKYELRKVFQIASKNWFWWLMSNSWSRHRLQQQHQTLFLSNIDEKNLLTIARLLGTIAATSLQIASNTYLECLQNYAKNTLSSQCVLRLSDNISRLS